MRSVTKLIELAVRGEDYKDWYAYASAQIEQATDLINIVKQPEIEAWSADQVADLLSVFSPRVSVSRSVKAAITYAVKHEYVRGTIRNTKAAVKHYALTGEIRGLKTSEFAQSLKLEPNAVCLDVWMARALQVDQKTFATKSGYAKASARVRKVADKLGWESYEVQAAVWGAYLRSVNRSVAYLDLIDDTLYGKKLVFLP